MVTTMNYERTMIDTVHQDILGKRKFLEDGCRGSIRRLIQLWSCPGLCGLVFSLNIFYLFVNLKYVVLGVS